MRRSATTGPHLVKGEGRLSLHFLDNGLHFLDKNTLSLAQWFRMRSNEATPLSSREVIAGTAIEPHPPTALAGDDAEASCLI
jgi:hypothetical protein